MSIKFLSIYLMLLCYLTPTLLRCYLIKSVKVLRNINSTTDDHQHSMSIKVCMNWENKTEYANVELRISTTVIDIRAES